MEQLILITLVAGAFIIGLSVLNSYKDERIKSKFDNCISCGKTLTKDEDNTVLFDGVICSECTDIALKTNALTPQAKALGKRGFKFTKSETVRSEVELFKKSHKGSYINNENKGND